MNDLPDEWARADHRGLWFEVGGAVLGGIAVGLLVLALVIV